MVIPNPAEPVIVIFFFDKCLIDIVYLFSKFTLRESVFPTYRDREPFLNTLSWSKNDSTYTIRFNKTEQ